MVSDEKIFPEENWYWTSYENGKEKESILLNS